uniref:CAAX prenyl protease 2 n=1 Tax=Echeneis naucrates TaxID=173247 RepID=A0A665U8Q2_ECHNA
MHRAEPGHGLIGQVEFAHTKCWLCVPSCFLLACVYVGGLYVWRSSLPRDHPGTIKRRCAGVLLVSALSPACSKRHISLFQVDASVWELMGVHLEGFVPAVVLPLLLTMVNQRPPTQIKELERRIQLCFGDVVWLRNQVVAPLMEELVFRGAMLPMLVPCVGPTAAIFMAPLFFGVAHFHHITEQRRLQKASMRVILLMAGHIVGPVLCHSFCNPLLFSYAMEALLFLLLLFPLTDLFFYGAIPICSLAPAPARAC